ncbi:MAG: hypothetical protein Q4B58_02485 [Bacteroidales bacterium]|nr:hypothetical protein [Bacteroidales bacterium]
MAQECTVSILGDYAMVHAQDSSLRGLRFDISKAGCRMYENSRQQSKDFFDEIIKWFGGRPANADSISKSLQLYLITRRREYGLPA